MKEVQETAIVPSAAGTAEVIPVLPPEIRATL